MVALLSMKPNPFLLKLHLPWNTWWDCIANLTSAKPVCLAFLYHFLALISHVSMCSTAGISFIVTSKLKMSFSLLIIPWLQRLRQRSLRLQNLQRMDLCLQSALAAQGLTMFKSRWEISDLPHKSTKLTSIWPHFVDHRRMPRPNYFRYVALNLLENSFIYYASFSFSFLFLVGTSSRDLQEKVFLLFQDDHYFGPSVDIWALGILLYLMVTGSMPFKGTTVAELKNAILDGHFEMPDYLSQNCIDLIAGILKRRSDWRLTLAQVNHAAATKLGQKQPFSNYDLVKGLTFCRRAVAFIDVCRLSVWCTKLIPQVENCKIRKQRQWLVASV